MISLWNDLATTVGQELLDIADQSPIIAVKYLRAGDFQGTANIEVGNYIWGEVHTSTPNILFASNFRCIFVDDKQELNYNKSRHKGST